jgi:hypothetical protein
MGTSVYYLKIIFMKPNYCIFTLISVITLFSCKKPNPTIPATDIVHKVVNRAVKASDPNPMAVDINDDGTIDYSYFAQLMANSAGDHLYIGVNPIGENLTKMGPPDDDRFLNMGDASALSSGNNINDDLLPSKLWSADFAFLAVRNTSMQNNITYEGAWGDGNGYFMPLRLYVKDKTFYGWAHLKFNKTTEQLILIEYAWNRNAGQELKAGQK